MGKTPYAAPVLKHLQQINLIHLNFSAIGCRYTKTVLLIHKASINKTVSGFSDILIGSRYLHMQNVLRVLRKWTPRGKNTVKYPNFPSRFYWPKMFWRNFTKIRQICILSKFGQSGSIPQKIKT